MESGLIAMSVWDLFGSCAEAAPKPHELHWIGRRRFDRAHPSVLVKQQQEGTRPISKVPQSSSVSVGERANRHVGDPNGQPTSEP